MKSFIFAFFVLAFAHSLNAESIKAIVVEGNQRLGDDAVKQYLGQKVGDTFDRTRVREDLKTLYNTGLFQDVRMDLDDVAGGVKLIIVVKERDYIQRVQFAGNNEVGKDDLQKALDFKLPFLWDEAQVKQSIEKLRKLYRDKGFFLVTIRTEVMEEGKLKTLKFEIDEGSQVKVRRIYFQGNEVFTDQKLKEAMITKEGAFWRSLSRMGVFDQELITQIDTRRVQLEYLKTGYAYAKVDNPSIVFTPDRSSVVIGFHVVEGERYKIGKITFSGDLDFIPEPEKLAADLKTRPQRWWNILKIQEDIQTVQDLYGNHGYAYANVSPNWVASPSEPNTLDIDFRVEKGSLVYMGNIDIQGNQETLDRVIRRELEISEGELFNITRYRDSQKNLEKLGFFEEVKFIQKDRLAEQKMDLTIEVKEKQTGSLQLGATFSSFDRFGVQGSVSKVNLFGRGYDTSLSATFSAKRQMFNAYFRNPRVNDSLYSLTFQAFNTEVQSVDETRIVERGGSVGVGYPLSKNWRINGTYGIKDIKINIEDIIKGYFPDSVGLDSNFALNVTRDTLNTREIFLPSSGSLNSFTATLASKYMGSNLSYLLLNYTGKKYLEVFDNDVPLVGGSVLSFGLRADYIRGTEDRSTPYNERFVPGGIYSIRGHLFRTLGPFVYAPFPYSGIASKEQEYGPGATDKLRLGGNKQLIFNVEYLFDIFKEARIKGVLFFDAGNTFQEKDYDVWNLRRSVGFGFRWFSPLGPLRFEWGIPLDRKKDEDNILFDFSIGAPF